MILPSNLDEMVPVKCNTGDDEILANVRSACSRTLPWLQFSESTLGRAVLVGGGPSVRAFLPTIKKLQEDGATVFAFNGTMGMLCEAGVTPDHFVLLEGRKESLQYLTRGKAKHYLIAAQCNPEAFEMLWEADVTLWHPDYAGVREIVGERDCVFIGGGTTVGLQTLSIAYALGHRQIDLYGFDSSYSGTEGHAYAQDQNKFDQAETFWVGSKSFLATPWMLRQAMEFQTASAQLAEAGCEIAVHGSGLLPEIARVMANGPDEYLDAVYDLSVAPASYDFVTWLGAAEMARKRGGHRKLRVSFLDGPKDGFRDDPLPGSTDFKKQIVTNVILPALTMIGAEEGTATDGWRSEYVFRALHYHFKRGEDLPRMKAPNWAKVAVQHWLKGRHPVVVTLREAEHWPERNSNMDAWLRFARETRDVVFVRDTLKAEDPLEGFEIFPAASRNIAIRQALYEEARLNMLVSNGPAILLWLSDSPFVQFNLLKPGFPAGEKDWIETFIGLTVGDEYPFRNSHQRIVWEDDNYEAITRAYREFEVPLAKAG